MCLVGPLLYLSSEALQPANHHVDRMVQCRLVVIVGVVFGLCSVGEQGFRVQNLGTFFKTLSKSGQRPSVDLLELFENLKALSALNTVVVDPGELVPQVLSE